MTMSGQQVSRELGAAIIRAVQNAHTPAAELARLARLAKEEGASATAIALAERARGAARGVAVKRGQPQSFQGDEAQGQVSDKPAVVLPGTESGPWKKFTETLAAGRVSDAEQRGRIGRYAVSVRRLCDLGICTNPRKVRDDKGGTWEADWNPKLTKENFLASIPLQDKVLRKSMELYADTIREKFSRALGRKLEDRDITLSGLLAVAHVSGERGLESWLRDGQVREKFSGTTKLFRAANGIF